MALLIIVILVLIVSVILMYNNLIRKINAVENSFHSIDVMLKKRYDLIPRLVETVKGYMQHEKDVLLQLTHLRSTAMGDGVTMNQKVMIDNEISAGIEKIIVSVEAYPDLKSSQNFLHLQGSLNESEEQLAASRRFFNAAVNDYQNAIQTFPSSIVAGMMKLKPKTFFRVNESETKVPSITV